MGFKPAAGEHFLGNLGIYGQGYTDFWFFFDFFGKFRNFVERKKGFFWEIFRIFLEKKMFFLGHFSNIFWKIFERSRGYTPPLGWGGPPLDLGI